jgi:hypothetical protein
MADGPRQAIREMDEKRAANSGSAPGPPSVMTRAAAGGKEFALGPWFG